MDKSSCEKEIDCYFQCIDECKNKKLEICNPLIQSYFKCLNADKLSDAKQVQKERNKFRSENATMK